ncbi:MAG TPA: glycosyltransferase [Caulobacteraceae bacterium]|nr:glycosyltransferase [Caulobacteraceae bacterium]
MKGADRPRVFWLGAHKVLKHTELAHLRELGFEVFNPPYISPIYDQSMDLRLDFDQPTTLPPAEFARLMAHDFFYTVVPEDIAELLNAYFDAIVVTINANWLKSILDVFHGRVIYRIYGQHFSLSQKIVEIGLWPSIICREDFAIVPFALESVEREHRWFLDLCADFVPYQIPDDVFEYTGAWAHRADHKVEIATSIPNILNPYFAAAYADFCADYPHRIFSIYGPQRAHPADPRIVGALHRRTFLERLAASAGYLYNYKDGVCYLPPIEMMQMAGPVLYARGSLLARFYGEASVGRIEDRVDAERKLRWLLHGDERFIGELVAAQEPVRRRYDRAVVRPVFAEVFSRLLGSDKISEPSFSYSPPMLAVSGKSASPRRQLYVLMHADGLVVHQNGRAYAFEGIPRVVDVLVDALAQWGDLDVTIVTTLRSSPAMRDFFAERLAAGRVRLHVLELGEDREDEGSIQQRLSLIEKINADPNTQAVLVPHYYLFPEALLLNRDVVLYLPDYFPHLMPDVAFDVSRDKDRENKAVGVAIASKARRVLTNSEFTRGYLADAGFVAANETEKVVVAPLPLLGARRAEPLDEAEQRRLSDALAGRRFLFYPTANRPNKQWVFLLRLFANARLAYPDLALVLTGSLTSVPGVAEAAARWEVGEHLLFLHHLEEGSVRWLYERCAALCLTSTLEGNFPPQMLEAFTYGAPIVATRLPTITEALGDLASELLLCEPLQLEDFRAKLAIAIDDRRSTLARQARVWAALRARNTPEAFFRRVAPMFGVRAPAEAA